MLQNTINSLLILSRYIIFLVLLFNSKYLLAVNFSEEIKSYITNIQSIAVEFTQSDSRSEKSTRGMLIIDKPYKFRCNYYEPFPLLIIGNKNYVSIYDYEMENLSRIKAKENIFNFLLVDKVKIEDQFEILSNKKQNKNYIIRLKHLESNKISEVVFDIKSKEIRTMKIFEEDNIITLTFDKTKMISRVAKSLFIIQNPNIFDKPKRLNKLQLEKKFNEL